MAGLPVPEELIQSVGECLDTEIDVLRFRAVCKLWRSSRTPLKKFPCGEIKLPYPFQPYPDAYTKRDDAYFTLVERIVYRIQHPESRNFWLLKVERLSNGKFRILNPASHHQILPGTQMPKVLNTLNLRISEVCKAYALKCVNPSEFMENGEYGLAKKVLFRKGGRNDDDYCVMAIDSDNNSWYINSGEDRWRMVGGGNYVDILNLKGQFYGVDPWGGIWEFDSMFGRRIFANGVLHNCTERHLAVSDDGNLHLVEKVIGEKICTSSGEVYNRITSYLVCEAVLGVRIWAFNKRQRAWVWADPSFLNGRIIFAGEDCSFSLSSTAFDGCNGHRVFYTNKWISFQTHEDMQMQLCDHVDSYCCTSCWNVVRVNQSFVSTDDVKRRFRGLHGHNTGVCDTETLKIGSLLMYHEYADIFWPPPSWLTRQGLPFLFKFTFLDFLL
ncbi:hypothetical protein ACS0TY_001026 [Phlomoides rotata]